MPDLELPIVDEPDQQAIDEALYETYLDECYQNKQTPSFKDYKVWLDERF